jgi:cytochrome c556
MSLIDRPIQWKLPAASFAGRLYAGLGIWLFAGLIEPCNEPPRSADQTAPAPVAAAPAQTTAKSAEPSAAHAPAAPHQQTVTTRHYMLTHYTDTVGMRRALVAGKLAGYRAAASAVASDAWTPQLRGDYQPHIDAVRAAAHAGETASSAVAAAAALGKLGEACAACHLKFGGPGSPVAPEQLTEGTDPSMVAHAAATDRLWEGLILPSDSSWSSGMEVLLDAPRLDSDVADVSAAARHLSALARQGKSADVAQRGQIFASVLTTCAGCHERLGVASRPAPSLEHR